jgi:hypothetical protein
MVSQVYQSQTLLPLTHPSTMLGRESLFSFQRAVSGFELLASTIEGRLRRAHLRTLGGTDDFFRKNKKSSWDSGAFFWGVVVST